MAALRLPRALSARLSTISRTQTTPTPIRHFTTTLSSHSSWQTGPAPPRLPKEEQELFEKLQKQSTGAFSSAKPIQEPEATFVADADRRFQVNQSPQVKVEADGEGEELHPNIRRGAKPEFEGDVNPKTGEVGGPKNEPLRWGSTDRSGDWSYNGRVTDF